MGSLPMVAVLRDIRSVLRLNPAIAERSSSSPSTVAALELDRPEYRPMQWSTIAHGQDAHATGSMQWSTIAHGQDAHATGSMQWSTIAHGQEAHATGSMQRS